MNKKKHLKTMQKKKKVSSLEKYDINGLRDYLEEFKKLAEEDPEAAKIAARVSLIRSGVLNEDGSPKENIVDEPSMIGYDVQPMSYEEVVSTMKECIKSLSELGNGNSKETHDIAVQALVDSGFVSKNGHVIVREKRSPQVEEFFKRIERQTDISGRQRVRK